MASFPYVDRQGTTWMILAGLPVDFPEGGENDGPFAGLTFRASTGEVRVLPRAASPRRARAGLRVPFSGTRTQTRGLESAYWEELLRHAIAWPPKR
jgi:hypothetical protein